MLAAALPIWIIPMWTTYLTAGLIALAFGRRVPAVIVYGIIATLVGSFMLSLVILIAIRDGIR